MYIKFEISIIRIKLMDHRQLWSFWSNHPFINEEILGVSYYFNLINIDPCVDRWRYIELDVDQLLSFIDQIFTK